MRPAVQTKMENVQLTLSSGSLEGYTHSVSQVPVLSREEEFALTTRLREHGDLDAARQLILSHLRFVVYIASGYRGYGLAQNDLIQEGNIGLMKAVKRFDPSRGVRLVSFAVHWIRAEIHEFVLCNWRVVKVATTKAQRKLFFKLRSKKKRLGWMSHEQVGAVASDLGVKPEEVLEMESRLSTSDASFDGHEHDPGEGHSAPVLRLSDQQPTPEQAVETAETATLNQGALVQAMALLDGRARDIIKRRWLRPDNKSTLQELAKEYGVSAERIRQIERDALAKMRQGIGDTFSETADTALS